MMRTIKGLRTAVAAAVLGLVPVTALAQQHDFYPHDFYRGHDDDRRDVRFDFGFHTREVASVQRVWVAPVYSTVCEQVWVAPVVRDECDRVWVPAVYEYREVVRSEGYRRVIVREPALVCAGHYEERHHQVVVTPGHFDNVERQVLVSAGHWEDCVTPAPERNFLSFNFGFRGH